MNKLNHHLHPIPLTGCVFTILAAILICVSRSDAGSVQDRHQASDAITEASAASWNPDEIHWQRINADGTRFALLEGQRDSAGSAFSYAFFIPAGVWDAAHSHTADARVFVARGNLRLGYGDQLDEKSAIAYPSGSYLLVPAGARHFDGATEDTLIFGTAIGPWSTHYVEATSKSSAGSTPK